MSTADPTHARPLVVLAGRKTDELQELETALYSAGYLVVTAHAEHDTLQKIHVHKPDAVVLDQAPGERGYELCRTVRNDPGLSVATPILLTQDIVPTPEQRLDALRAGAWHVQGPPPDGIEELLLRLAIHLPAKLEVDRLTDETMIDGPTGLYNTYGFTQRADELAALTSRQGVPSACAVFRPAEALPPRASGDQLGRAFKSVSRLSDATGRTALTEFAVFAPAMHDWAAERLVRRMSDTVTGKVGRHYGKDFTLRAAYSAAMPARKVDPRVLLERARQVLESHA